MITPKLIDQYLVECNEVTYTKTVGGPYGFAELQKIINDQEYSVTKGTHRFCSIMENHLGTPKRCPYLLY